MEFLCAHIRHIWVKWSLKWPFSKKWIFVCLLYCTHFWSAFLKKCPPPSVGKDVILHICAKGFVLKTRTTENPNFPGRKFASNFDSYRHCLLSTCQWQRSSWIRAITYICIGSPLQILKKLWNFEKKGAFSKNASQLLHMYYICETLEKSHT